MSIIYDYAKWLSQHGSTFMVSQMQMDKTWSVVFHLLVRASVPVMVLLFDVSSNIIPQRPSLLTTIESLQHRTVQTENNV